MTNYILKRNENEENILLFQEKSSYSFTSFKNYKGVKKITVFDEDMLSAIWLSKLQKQYNRLLKIIYSLILSDDSNSGDVLIAHTELERIKEYLESLKIKGLSKKYYDNFKGKLYVLELELKKVHVINLQNEIEEREYENGKSR